MIDAPGLRAAFVSVLVVVLATALLGAQWTCDSSQNEPLAVQPERQNWPLVEARSDGGMYFAWHSWTANGPHVRLQRYAPDGLPLWGPDGILVSDNFDVTGTHWQLLVDSSDGVVIALADMRDDPSREVYLYRFEGQGAALWGSDGLRVSVSTNVDYWPHVAELPAGDFVVVWSSDPGLPTIPGSIRMQRVTPSGAPHFPTSGVQVASSAPITAPQRPRVLPVGSDAVLIAWLNGLDAPINLLAQRFSSTTGAAEWSFPVPVLDDPASNALNAPTLVAGPSESVWIAFNKTLSGQLGPAVQRLDANAQEGFPHNGILLATDSTTGTSPEVAYDEQADSIALAWVGVAGYDFALRAQRVGPTGNLEWPAGSSGGTTIATPSANFKEGVTLERLAEGVSVGWIESTPLGMRTVAQIVSEEGLPQLGADGVELTPAAGIKFGLVGTAIADGQVVFAWEDTRTGEPNVFGQLLDVNGGLGGPQLGTHCAAKLDDLGCLPAMTWSGAPRLVAGSSFTIGAQDVAAQRTGLFVYGFGQAQTPFSGGLLCAAPPLKKLGLQNAGGAGGASCSGSFSINFQSTIDSGQDPLIAPGATLAAQWLYRSPGTPGGFGQSDGIVFYLCP